MIIGGSGKPPYVLFTEMIAHNGSYHHNIFKLPFGLFAFFPGGTELH
jgi:hypothetical protein